MTFRAPDPRGGSGELTALREVTPMSSQCQVYEFPRRPPSSDDPNDRDRLVLDHLGLAQKLASRYAGRGEPLEELTQVAMLVLGLAARRLDCVRSTRFISFVAPPTRCSLCQFSRSP